MSGRDGSQFVALPFCVIDSAAFRHASHPARALLIDLARQFSGKNNGRLVATSKALKPLGWTSHDTVTRALRELEERRLIQLTRRGARPNLAAWYALTWQALNADSDMEVTSRSFDRSGYKHWTPQPTPQSTREKIVSLVPRTGIKSLPIGPANGAEEASLTPTDGAMWPTTSLVLSRQAGGI